MTEFTATYSPEDNKLRLYACSRLDEETYSRVKAQGFKWAPKQELFVVPSWSPEREDFCLEMAGEIEREEMTLLERAEAKAERLDALSSKRAQESNRHFASADQISQRFYGGQPILVGHHSERKARNDQRKMHSAMDNSVKAEKAAVYWGYRATGVERHANRKNSPGVRARRIQTLLKDLRGLQRDTDHAYFCLEVWGAVADKLGTPDYCEAVETLSGAYFKTGKAAAPRVYNDLCKGEITHEECVNECIEHHERVAKSPRRLRCIEHTLNRIAYERAELGPVERFDGKLTATVLQVFARENGVCSPKADATESGFKLRALSRVPLPLHIGEGVSLELTTEEWRDFMQACGYSVPSKGPTKPPILNFQAAALVSNMYGNRNAYPQIEMTKAEYSEVHGDYKGVRLSICGTFRFRTVMVKHSLNSVFLTDSKAHPAPESDAIQSNNEQGAA